MPANLLLLDEPTNHLDVDACESLERFLLDGARTLLLVSHDRRTLERICTALWVVDGGRVAHDVLDAGAAGDRLRQRGPPRCRCRSLDERFGRRCDQKRPQTLAIRPTPIAAICCST